MEWYYAKVKSAGRTGESITGFMEANGASEAKKRAKSQFVDFLDSDSTKWAKVDRPPGLDSDRVLRLVDADTSWCNVAVRKDGSIIRSAEDGNHHS